MHKRYAQKSVSQRHDALTPVQTGHTGQPYTLATWPDGRYGVAHAGDARGDLDRRITQLDAALAAVAQANARQDGV